MASFRSMVERHNDRNDLSRNDRSYSSCTNQNQSDSFAKMTLRDERRAKAEASPTLVMRLLSVAPAMTAME
jgi:hypothetical protein